MKTKNIFSKSVFLLGICSLTACNLSTSTKIGNPKLDGIKKVEASQEKIRNGVQFQETGGVKVTAAFLMHENGELVSDENMLMQEEHFKLILKISGWKAENGQVQLGAIEQVHDGSRPVPLEGADLFADSKGLSEEDAQIISLNMGIPATSAAFEVYQTDFKVWNKSADQEIQGSYRFQLTK